MVSSLFLNSALSFQGSFGATFISLTATSVNTVAKEFFTHFFMHPISHLPLLFIFSAIAIGSTLGPLYLIKKTYDARVKGTTLSQELDFILKWVRMLI